MCIRDRFKSRPLRPQPLFREFVGAALARVRDRAPEVEPSAERSSSSVDTEARA